MDCEKKLSERPGYLSPSLGLPVIALTLSKPLIFSGLQFFPKDFGQVISIDLFYLKTGEIYMYKRKMTFALPVGHIYLRFEKSILPMELSFGTGSITGYTITVVCL